MPLCIAQEIAQAIPQGLVSEDPEVLSEAAWIAYYLTAHHQDLLGLLVDSKLLPVILGHLHSHCVEIQYPILKVFGNISGGCDRICEKIATQSFINAISPLLTHPNSLVKKEVLFIFSNFLAGSSELTMMVLESHCIGTIVEFMTCNKFQLRKEAVWGICNAAACKDVRAVAKIMEMDVLRNLVQCLADSDANLLRTVVDALKHIFGIIHRQFKSEQRRAPEGIIY